MKWYTTLGLEGSDTTRMVLNAQVPPGSPWFDGHFPEDPTLPGIAQLGMAVDAIRLAEKRTIQVRKFRRVRFKRVIRPGETLKIEVTPKNIDDGSYAFRILAENELACNGVLFIKDPTKANSKEEIP